VASEELKKDSETSPSVVGAQLTYRPWGTLIMAVLAVAVFVLPSASAKLVYDRALILEGELWRSVTGNWVHFSGSHLFWNLVVLVPTGVWLERYWPRRARILFVVAPIAIGSVLMVLDPELSRYAGLSGVASGVLVLLALTQLASSANDRWFWRAVLGLIVLKLVAEMLVQRPYFARFVAGDVYAVPLAHLTGVFCACALHFRGRRKPL
jgi:rhomboid family GlyGly-CTERM serine protease